MTPEATLRSALRDAKRPPPDGVDAAALIAHAEAQRVMPLLSAALRAAGTLDRWPDELVRAFSDAERAAAMIDCIRQRELVAVLEALAAAGVRALLFKGAALAQTHYLAPHLRPRTDTDILIPAAQITAAEQALIALAYVPQQETSGELVSYQSHFGKQDRHRVFHAVDVHWKISNRQTLAGRIGFDELWSTRRPLPSLGSTASTASPVYALLLALVHRAGHHPGSSNLLWMWDVHLLVSAMTDDELSAFTRLAADRDLGAIVHEGLRRSVEWFGTSRLEGPLDAIRPVGPAANRVDVITNGSQAGVLRQDVRALTTWRQRGRLVREHLFPPASYMRGKYRARSPLVLPALYAWRIVSGAPRWLRRRDDAG
jgi:hypothetical protein